MTAFEAAKEKLKGLKQERSVLQAKIDKAPGESEELKLELSVLLEDILSASASVARLGGERLRKGDLPQNSIGNSTFVSWACRDNVEGNPFREAQLSALENTPSLTKRQSQVLALKSEGKQFREIADKLGVTQSTLSRTYSRAKNKLDVYTQFYQKTEHAKEETIIDLDDNAILRILSEQLTPRQQVALYLHFGERLSYSLCGELLGKSKATIIQTAHRGIARLAKHFPDGNLCFKNADTLPDKILKAYFYMQNDFQVLPQNERPPKETMKTMHRNSNYKPSGPFLGDEREVIINYKDGSLKTEKVAMHRKLYGQRAPFLLDKKAEKADRVEEKKDKTSRMSELLLNMISLAKQLGASLLETLEALMLRLNKPRQKEAVKHKK